jgi:hypothetical protein
MGGLGRNGKLCRYEACGPLRAGDDEAFVGCELHLKCVRYVVLNEVSRFDKLVGAVVDVFRGGGDTEVVNVEADDKTGVSPGQAVEDGLKGGPELIRGCAAAGRNPAGRIPRRGDGPPVREPPRPLVRPQGHAKQGRGVLHHLGGTDEIGMPHMLECLF